MSAPDKPSRFTTYLWPTDGYAYGTWNQAQTAYHARHGRTHRDRHPRGPEPSWLDKALKTLYDPDTVASWVFGSRRSGRTLRLLHDVETVRHAEQARRREALILDLFKDVTAEPVSLLPVGDHSGIDRSVSGEMRLGNFLVIDEHAEISEEAWEIAMKEMAPYLKEIST